MAIFCWGNTANGELGLGGIEDELILTPRKMLWEQEEKVIQASCGPWHTLFLTSDGKIFSCGKNDNGQLGHEMATKRPRMSFNHISTLDNYTITQISCGQNHSLALNEWGQVFSWGSNDLGQLGNGEKSSINLTPKIMKNLLSNHVVQVACGSNHSLALSNCGDLFTWGSNTFGQLGIANPSEHAFSSTPVEVTSLKGIPIAFIACGSNHSFVISKSGAVFGWGRNDCGQLGLNDQTPRMFPTQLKTLRTLGVRYISCGEDFSVFLTNEGGVFTCGAGTYGQLGHGSISNEVLPRKVVELMGSTITQVKCGSRHTLAFVPSRGRVYGFGLGGSGQLGTRSTKNSLIPQIVHGPWVSPSGSGLFEKNGSNVTSMTIRQIFCGGDHSLAITCYFKDHVPAVDSRIHNPKTQILVLSSETAYQCSLIDKNASVDLDLISSIESIFKSQACLNSSFLLSGDRHFCCTSNNHGVDLNLAITTFEHLGRIENENLKQIIWDSITNYLLKSLVPSPADVETLRIYLILPLYREFVNSKNYENLHTQFSNAILNLKEIPKKIVSKWWASTSNDFFEQLVTNFKDVVAHIISARHALNSNSNKQIVTYNSYLVAALNLLSFLNRINLYERKEKIDYEIFHWTELTEYVDIQQDYIHWLFGNNQTESFNICNYPFLFNASTKTTLLQTDQAIQMQNAMQNAAATGMLSFLNFGTPVSQFIVLNVSRDNIVQDTLREIMQYNQADLKKPLKIKFYDEEAEDAGGVRKEFFMLLLKDLIDPKYGMFKEFEDSRAVWFSDVSFETDEMYFLIGIICGLAIYNFTIINLPFPLALYKKLLKEPTDLTDMRDLSPTIANSLQSILDYNELDFEEVFGLNFEITRDVFGESKVEFLKPGGDKIPVTLENKAEFVDLYVDFIFNKSVNTQFTAFQNGFMKVCWGRVLQIFKPHELMAVVVGNEDYDWDALETNTQYKDGYTSSDQTIRWFWEVFHELPLAEKKKFLLFLTGSDRIPIQGMKAISIIIQPTNDEKCLPVAHTCFNLLDLPRYKTKERLKYKLLQAIQQTQGFSLV